MSVNWSQELLNREGRERDAAHEELEVNTHQVLNDVRGIQDKIAALGDKPDPQKLSEYNSQLDKAQAHLKDLYHPEKNPGALQHVAGFIRQHLLKRPMKTAAKTPAEAKTSLAELNSYGAGVGAQSSDDKIGLWMKDAKGNLIPARLDNGKAVPITIPEGMTAEGTTLTKPPRYSDYTAGLRRFVQAEGGDPDNPTSAEEDAYRKQIVKDKAVDTTSTSTTTDPFGVSSTTHSVRHRGPAGDTPNPVPKTPGEAKKNISKVAPAGKQLDAQGHIPATAPGNLRLREAANQLLDGMDIAKLPLPTRDREAAAALAKEYGWKGQGVFGPKDMLMLRESTSILKQLAGSNSLSVFDSFSSRQKVAQVIQNPDKRGVFGQATELLAAANLSKDEQDFVTLYNQAVGRISGLSQLVRSGRATEATIERLKTELPNPFNTTSSGHAREKLAQIQNEIDIALQKGQFSDSGSTSDDDFLKNF